MLKLQDGSYMTPGIWLRISRAWAISTGVATRLKNAWPRASQHRPRLAQTRRALLAAARFRKRNAQVLHLFFQLIALLRQLRDQQRQAVNFKLLGGSVAGRR